MEMFCLIVNNKYAHVNNLNKKTVVYLVQRVEKAFCCFLCNCL